MVVAALLVVVWPVNRPDHDQQRCNLQLTLNKGSPIKKESPLLMANDTLYFHGHKTSSQEHVSLYQIKSHICLMWKLSETH
jgi:hypothetical protein